MAATDDVFSSNEPEFDKFQKQFVAAVAADPAKHGLLNDDVVALQAAQAAWEPAYAAHIKAQETARTATQTKDGSRAKLEASLRSAARKINGSTEVDNALRASVGLATRSGTRSVIGPPTTCPLGRTESAGTATLVLHFGDAETPKSHAKPQGVQGCQIWSFVGEKAPVDPSEYAFIALDTRTPYTDVHPPVDAGKTISYLLRWQNAKGETGPWSSVITAKIPL
jgi:hypothetical protein